MHTAIGIQSALRVERTLAVEVETQCSGQCKIASWMATNAKLHFARYVRNLKNYKPRREYLRIVMNAYKVQPVARGSWLSLLRYRFRCLLERINQCLATAPFGVESPDC